MSLPVASRRQFLKALAGAGAALPLARFFPESIARAAGRSAERVVFMYVPDGMHEADWGTSGRQWGALGSRAKDCSLLQGVYMDEDRSQEGHPGGAKRLLCGDNDYGTSFDLFLARGAGASAYYPHLYLGAYATRKGSVNNGEMISYEGGSSPKPEDNPIVAFGKLFPGGTVPASGGPSSGGGQGGTLDTSALARRKSVLDTVLADLQDLKGSLSGSELKKLERHLEATREVEKRVQKLIDPSTSTDPSADDAPLGPAKCSAPVLDGRGLDGTSIFEATRFPDVVSAQLDVLTQALACGTTRVATLQMSRHTSDLFMPFADGPTKQQSHEASHNNQSVYLEQRVWFMQQLKGLLDRLAERDDPYVQGATLLDRTLVLFCTEINWGPNHKYFDMPFILAGGTGGKLRSGGAVQVNAHHTHVLSSIASALGTSTQGFRDAPQPVSGLTG